MNEQIDSILNQLTKERKLVRRTGYILGILPLVGLAFMVFLYGLHNGAVRPYGGDFIAVTMLFASPTMVLLGVNLAVLSFGVRSRMKSIKEATEITSLVASLQRDFSKDKTATRILGIVLLSLLVAPVMFVIIGGGINAGVQFSLEYLWAFGGYFLLMGIFSLVASSRITRNLEKLAQIDPIHEENTNK